MPSLHAGPPCLRLDEFTSSLAATQTALMWAILEHPADDPPRPTMAGWHEEQGIPAHAEYRRTLAVYAEVSQCCLQT